MITPWLKLSYPEKEFHWFFNGGWKQWADDYRGILFNDRDIQSKENSTQRHNYFHEWFSAITIFNRYDLRSFGGWYAAKDAAHRNKVEAIRERVSQDVGNAITTPVTAAKSPTAGLPDLFVYRDDNKTEWFFAEMKGPTDKISKTQEMKSDGLDQAAGKNVVRPIELETTTERFTPPHPHPRPR